MSKATDATGTKSLSAFVLSLSLSATKKSHVRAWEGSQMQTRQHPSWVWTASTLRVCAWEPCYLEQTLPKWVSAHGFAARPKQTQKKYARGSLCSDWHFTSALREKKNLLGERIRSVWLTNLTSILFATALMNLKRDGNKEDTWTFSSVNPEMFKLETKQFSFHVYIFRLEIKDWSFF